MSKRFYKNISKKEKQQQVKELFQQIDTGVKNMFTSEHYMNYLNFVSKFHKYSFNNIQLIKSQFPKATMVASYVAWEKNFNRKVKKGEKGIKILVPAPYKYFYTEDEKGKKKIVFLNQATEEQKQQIEKGEIKLQTGLTFKIGHVFDISQTEGEAIPSLCKELKGNNERAKQIFDATLKIIDIPVKYEDLGTSKGCYYLLKNYIALNKNNNINQNAKTLIHEFTHYKLHNINNKLANQKYKNTIEVEAESVAYIVCKYFSFDTSQYSFGYIGSWSKNRSLEELKNSAETIQNTAKEIIEEIENKINAKVEKVA